MEALGSRQWDIQGCGTHRGRALMLERAWGRASAEPGALLGSDAHAQRWGPGAADAPCSQSAAVLSPPRRVRPMGRGLCAWGHPCPCEALHVTSVR